jgi:hypothetical protein
VLAGYAVFAVEYIKNVVEVEYVVVLAELVETEAVVG